MADERGLTVRERTDQARDLLRLPPAPLVRWNDGSFAGRYVEAGEWTLEPEGGDTPANLRAGAAAFLAAAEMLEREGY